MLVFLFIIGCFFAGKKQICLKIVASGSMEPTFLVGSLCVIEQDYPIACIKTGDIIAFCVDEQTLVTHRILRIPKKGYFLTKGDANESPDIRWVSEREYRGKVIYNIPYIGIVCLFLFRQRRSVVFIIAAIFLWREIERRREIESKKREKMDDDSGHLCADYDRRKHNQCVFYRPRGEDEYYDRRKSGH